MILLLGQVGRKMRGREAFQEIDVKAFFGEVAKWVEEIDSAERIPEIFSRAMHMATSGRPGPVVLSLPEDMLRETATVADAAPWVEVETHPGLRPDGAASRSFSPARRGRSSSSAARAGARPRLRASGALPKDSICRSAARSAGRCSSTTIIRTMPAMSASASTRRSRDACEGSRRAAPVGGRMSEMPSAGYTLIDIPNPRQTLVHVHPGRGGAWPGLPSGARDQRQPERASSRRSKMLQPPRRRSAGPRRRAPPTRRTAPGRRRSPIPVRCSSDRWCLAARAASRRRDRDERRRQLYRLGASLLPLPPLQHAARADLRLDGLRPAGGDRRQAPLPGAHGRRASPATAASSSPARNSQPRSRTAPR